MQSTAPPNIFVNYTLDYFEISFDFLYNTTNVTDRSKFNLDDMRQDIPLGIVLTSLCLLTFVGNAMVLYAVKTERRLQSNSSQDYLDVFIDLFLNSTNVTENDIYVNRLWREIPLGVLLTFLCLLTFVGNSMVLYAVRTERRLQSVSNMFIVSLAIADLIVGMIVMPISTVYIFTEKWVFGVVICQMWIGVDYIASTASILNLFILSLDRYWSVTSPLKYIRKRTKKRAFIMISIVWLLSSLWIIPVVGWHHFMFGGVRTVPDTVCDTEYAKDSVFKVLTACFNYYFPLAAMYVLYWRIFLEIRKRSEMELGQRNVSDCNHYIPVNLSVDEESERNIETFSGEQSMHDAIFSSTLPENVERYELASMNDHTLNKVGYINMRYRKARQNGTCSGRPLRKFHLQNDRCKVDYIYDEGVFDQNTEKVERFFYEEITPLPSLPKPNHIIINNNMGSPETPCSSPSTPLSSSGSNEDKRQRTMDRDKYSLISGLRRLKEAENLNHTVNVENSKFCRTSSGTEDRRVFVFRDERTRCSPNVLSIKDRVKNMRQSSSLRKEIKAARQLGVIMGAFTVCFLPYFILFTVVAFCDDCIDRGLFTAMTWVGYLNSTLNPFLYPLCNLNFRRKFRNMLRLSRHSSIKRTKPGSERNSTIMGRYD